MSSGTSSKEGREGGNADMLAEEWSLSSAQVDPTGVGWLCISCHDRDPNRDGREPRV